MADICNSQIIVKPEKLNNFISISLSESDRQSLITKLPDRGDRSKLIRQLVKMYLAGEIKVVLPATEAREL